MQDTNSQNIPTFKELRAKVERICSTNMKVHSKSKTIKLYALQREKVELKFDLRFTS